MIALLTAAALLSTYDCEIETPRSLRGGSAAPTLNAIGLPPEVLNHRKFSIELSSVNASELPQAKVSWPHDPINVEGEYPAIPSSDESFALMAFSGGPCLFTEQACATTIQVVDQKTGPAKLLILPAALTKDVATNVREPFVVVISGQCAKRTAR